jgi:uncharacterized protein YcbX
MAGGIITALYQYPVKSMAGFSCATALALPSGFEWDRRWMLIDENNKMITQREIPKLCQFFPTIEEGQLSISFEGEHCSLPLHETIGPHFISQVWDDDTVVVRTSDAIDHWLSDRLGQKVSLVKVIERFHYAAPIDATIEVSGADGYPFLVLGTASLEHLSTAAGEPIDIRRFRPNIVITTITAHEEDDWSALITRDVKLQKVKPCLRCQVIDIDQDSGQRKGVVTKTLSTYRRMGNNIGFGASYLGLSTGELSVGDKFQCI